MKNIWKIDICLIKNNLIISKYNVIIIILNWKVKDMYLIAVYRENWEISTEKNALDRNLS